MSVELERRVAAVAARWEDAAAPIGLDELGGRGADLPDPGPVPVDDLDERVGHVAPAVPAVPFATPRPGRRRWIGVGAGIAAAASIVGLTVLAGRGDQDPGGPSDTIAPTTVVEPSAVPVPSTSAPTVPSSGPVPASTEPPPAEPPSTGSAEPASAGESLGETEAATLMAEIEVERAERLATFDSFRATVTTRNRYGTAAGDAPPVEITNETVLILRADGSLWAVPADGSPGSNAYDASTGVARAVWVDDSGATHAQELVGQTTNMVPLGVGVGFVPTALTIGLPTSVEEITSHLGRAAWSLTRDESSDVPGMPAGYHQHTTQVVDRQTGLVIAAESTWGDPSTGDQHTEARLTDLELGVDLPPEWPGAIPDGVVVDRAGDPTQFASPTLEDAVVQFGAPFAVPTDREFGAITIERFAWPTDVEGVDSTYVDLHLTARRGFRDTSIGFNRLVPVPGVPVPSGMAAVDGSWCLSTDGLVCSGDDVQGDITIDAGAYAGFDASWDAGALRLQVRGVLVTVHSATLDDALALVRSLEVVAAPA